MPLPLLPLAARSGQQERWPLPLLPCLMPRLCTRHLLLSWQLYQLLSPLRLLAWQCGPPVLLLPLRALHRPADLHTAGQSAVPGLA